MIQHTIITIDYNNITYIRTLFILTMITPVGARSNSLIDLKSLSEVSSRRGYTLTNEKFIIFSSSNYKKMGSTILNVVCT